MTDAQREAYLKTKTKNKTDMLKELVDSKVISQAQADALRSAIGKKGPKGEKKLDNKVNGMKNTLDSAVEAGTITKDQKDKILAYINKIKEDRKVEMDKVKSMTEAEKKAYFENKDKNVKSDMFSELVKAGTISQAQADKLKSMIPACQKGPGFRKHGDKQ